jgi:WD40 repeat protein
MIASGSGDENVRVWEVATGKDISIYTGHSQSISTLAWSPDGRIIASGSSDKTVQVWEAVTGKTLYTYTGHTGRINALTWSPDRRVIASASNVVHIWGIP